MQKHTFAAACRSCDEDMTRRLDVIQNYFPIVKTYNKGYIRIFKINISVLVHIIINCFPVFDADI